jgi:hypothetical protein
MTLPKMLAQPTVYNYGMGLRQSANSDGDNVLSCFVNRNKHSFIDY